MTEIKVGSRCRYVGTSVRDEYCDPVLSNGEIVEVVEVRDENSHHARLFPFRVKRPGAEKPIHFPIPRADMEILA